MEYKIVASEEAGRDFRRAKCYFDNVGLTNDFVEDYELQKSYLKSNPYLFQVYYKCIRKIHFKKYKYSIHYIIDNDIVYIFRILRQGKKYDIT